MLAQYDGNYHKGKEMQPQQRLGNYVQLGKVRGIKQFLQYFAFLKSHTKKDYNVKLNWVFEPHKSVGHNEIYGYLF